LVQKPKKTNRETCSEENSFEYEYHEAGADDEPEGEWRPYVSLRKRRELGAQETRRLTDQGMILQPLRVQDKVIATSTWGGAWCKNLETFSDFSSRLPPGRTYVRNGSIIHLQVTTGAIAALVQGTELYEVRIDIDLLDESVWQDLKTQCRGSIGSLLELLSGRVDARVMAVMAQSGKGLFPSKEAISFRCSCPDWAKLCKHVAASLYGVGHRFDAEPGLLFTLRGVDPSEMTSDAAKDLAEDAALLADETWNDTDLSQLFGIDLAALSPDETA
jgi:uncharacterized Zn finger protein